MVRCVLRSRLASGSATWQLELAHRGLGGSSVATGPEGGLSGPSALQLFTCGPGVSVGEVHPG